MAGKSKLSKATNQRRNTKSGRAKMPPEQFGVPGKKKYRIDDPSHARNALGRVAQYGSPAEKKQVRQRVDKKYPSIKVTGVRKKGGKGR